MRTRVKKVDIILTVWISYVQLLELLMSIKQQKVKQLSQLNVSFII